MPADVPHQTDPSVPLLATFWLDPDTDAAKRVVAARTGRAIQPIARSRVQTLAPRLRACLEERYSCPDAAELLEEVIRILAPRAGSRPTPPIDPRISSACALLRAAPRHRVPLAQVAASVSLSPSRLAHLLRPHLGLPVRRYLLWLRLRDALQEMAQGAKITEAAQAAGFADASHLDRTFRRMLGFTPSAALGVSQFVQDGASPAS